jgi:hypothetical protein
MFRFGRRRPEPVAEELDVCLLCGRNFVHPVDWHEAGRRHWWVDLRCGECGARRRGFFPDEAMQRLDRRLDDGQREISREADRMHLSWRSDEADAFAAALDRNLIEAHDFAF